MANIADGELTSLALCWRIERSDGAGLGLTSHDAPVQVGGVAYLPAPGILPAAVTRSLGTAASGGEVEGALSSDAMSERDLALGRWNGAGVRLTAVDWAQPDAPEIALTGGELGEVSLEGDRFAAELRGAAAKLDIPVAPTTSPECRATFGDKQCRVDLAGRSIVARVAAAEGAQLTLDRDAGDSFRFGRLRYLRGENSGLTTTILSVAGPAVRVRDLPRAKVLPGCLVELREGCDKRFATCTGRFANAGNFRGEPHLPGNDLLTRYPGA